MLREENNNEYKKKNEIELLNFYLNHLGCQNIKFESIKEGSIKTPDFFISDLKMIVEVKNLVVEHDLNNRSQSEISVERLKNALIKKGLTGEYVFFSDYFKIPRSEKKILKLAHDLIFKINKAKYGESISISEIIEIRVYHIPSQSKTNLSFNFIEGPEFVNRKSEAKILLEKILLKAVPQIKWGLENRNANQGVLLLFAESRFTSNHIIDALSELHIPSCLNQIWSILERDNSCVKVYEFII